MGKGKKTGEIGEECDSFNNSILTGLTGLTGLADRTLRPIEWLIVARNVEIGTHPRSV